MVSKMKKADLYKAYKELEQSHMKIEMELNDMKEENKKLKEKYEKFRVRNCDRMEELVKALSPWKKDHQDHKRILEAIVELKEENEKLKENMIKVPKGSMNYGYMKELEEENKKLKEENEKIGGLVISQTQKLRYVSIKHNELVEEKNKKILNKSDDVDNPPCVTCGGCHGRFVDGESYCDDWDCVNSDDDDDVLKPTPQGNKD